MFNSLINNEKTYSNMFRLINNFSDHKKNNKIKYYIDAYTVNNEKKTVLYNFLDDYNDTFNNILEKKKTKYFYEVNKEILYFFEWCNFDIYSEIKNIFDNLYKNDREREVIVKRASKKTLEDLGKSLDITRERVRQIEKKVKRRFAEKYISNRILSKISAERNGDMVLTPNEISGFADDYSTELLYLLTEIDNESYRYDKSSDTFILGNNLIEKNMNELIETLPEIIEENKLPILIEQLSKEYNVPDEMIYRTFNVTYTHTGKIYYRGRLSTSTLCENIINKYFKNGIKIHDEDEIKKFRSFFHLEYGNTKLPQNDRGLAAKISKICILCDRGTYKVKQNCNISDKLVKQIYRYIEDSDQEIFMINTLFSEFEDELIKEGVDNKHYLYGILKELYQDKFVFRRDYISKNQNSLSFYSLIVDYIKNSKYPVSKEELKDVFPGVTDIVFQFATDDECVLNYFGEYMHVDGW